MLQSVSPVTSTGYQEILRSFGGVQPVRDGFTGYAQLFVRKTAKWFSSAPKRHSKFISNV